MPSYLYTRDTPPENPAGDAPREYTKAEKRRNWWHYHWKWVLLAALAVLAIVATISGFASAKKPDLTVGIIAPTTPSSALTGPLQARLETLVGDVNGDGTVLVVVESYTITLDEAANPTAEAAGITRLTAAYETGECLLFMADPALAEAYQAQYTVFGTEDGHLPGPGATAEALTLPFFELAALNTAPIEVLYPFEADSAGAPGENLDGRQLLADYRVGLRALYGTKLENQRGGPAAWQQAASLLEVLKGNG